MLIDTFVNAIFLYDDKMVLTFNFKEGEETIQLKDLESTLTKDNNGSDMDCSGEPKKALYSQRIRGFPFSLERYNIE